MEGCIHASTRCPCNIGTIRKVFKSRQFCVIISDLSRILTLSHSRNRQILSYRLHPDPLRTRGSYIRPTYTEFVCKLTLLVEYHCRNCQTVFIGFSPWVRSSICNDCPKALSPLTAILCFDIGNGPNKQRMRLPCHWWRKRWPSLCPESQRAVGRKDNRR